MLAGASELQLEEMMMQMDGCCGGGGADDDDEEEDDDDSYRYAGGSSPEKFMKLNDGTEGNQFATSAAASAAVVALKANISKLSNDFTIS